jgi:hypothetical protein
LTGYLRAGTLRIVGIIGCDQSHSGEWDMPAGKAVAASAPMNWAAIKGTTDPSAMPANVPVSVLVNVTAGLAKLVDAVNQ